MRSNYLWYQGFRYGVVRPSLQLFYSDITVSGREHVPANKPVLFVANHQNSFLDALHVVTNTKRFVHFLTRADAFNNLVARYFLRSLNMLPVYRLRDGLRSVKNNNTTFDECYNIFQQGDAILIFAEANHDLKRRIRPLSKGFTRIAFGAEAENRWQLDLQVLPVGLGYGRHQKSRTPVHITFGEPISVADFKGLYQKDDREAARQLKQITAGRLKELTMHVPNKKHYPLYHLMLDDLEKNRQYLLDPEKVNARVKKIAADVDEAWLEKAERLYEQVAAHGIDIRSFIQTPKMGIGDLLLSPLHLFAFINNILPYQVVRWVTTEYIEDHVFDASAKYILGLLLFPLYYLLVACGFSLAGVHLAWGVVYVVVSIPTAPLFVRLKRWWRRTKERYLEEENHPVYRDISTNLSYFMKLRDKLFD